MAAPPRLIGTGTGHLASGSVPDAAAAGYTQRLLGGGNPLTRWSHRNRYDRTIAFCGAGPFADALDWGCGDGWFLRALHERGIVAGGLGVDFDPEMLAAGRAADPELAFAPPDTLDGVADRFDLVTCFETLEHVPAGEREAVVATLARVAAPGATVVVSVPIEVGPVLLVKQAGRRLADRDGGYGYEGYDWRELVRVGVLADTRGITPGNWHSHKGFDHRQLREVLGAHLEIEATAHSPLPALRAMGNATVLWRCRAR